MEPHRLNIPIMVIFVGVICCTIWFGISLGSINKGSHAEIDRVKIECFLHRDNADVHKLCVDNGYDR